jgi:hypothetical protein
MMVLRTQYGRGSINRELVALADEKLLGSALLDLIICSLPMPYFRLKLLVFSFHRHICGNIQV